MIMINWTSYLDQAAVKYSMNCIWSTVNFDEYDQIGKGLELLSANGGRFEMNQLLFADDTALVADSEEKLCRLVNEFGRVCKRRNLRAARQWAKDRKEWRALVYLCNWMSFTLPFLLGPVFFRTASRVQVVLTWRGEGCRYMVWLGYAVKRAQLLKIN